MVSCRKTSERFQDSVEGKLSRFVESLSSTYGVRLTVPAASTPASLKEFCSGLIEGRLHPWSPLIARLSRADRFSLGFSLFLFRKVIPSEKPQVGAYVRRMCEPSGLPDVRFVRFAISKTREMFPVGWDRSYLDKCSTSVLPLSSCYESGRKHGGCRGLELQDRWDREDFCSYVTESVAPRHRGFSRVQAIETGGKWRVISIPPRIDNALRPLHQCLYDKLSQEKWLLRGDAKASRFSDFTRLNGEVFVSGDYESATDNLNGPLQAAIMHQLLGNARSIPDGIRFQALSTFESLLEGDGVRGFQGRGQLMGQLTSFPLLCLINYITFKYSVRRDVPVKINGDDIVFRSTREECDRWFKNVKLGGLTLSTGKTLVDSRFFTLNSTLFQSSFRSVRAVPFVRSTCLWPAKQNECERIASLASRFYAFARGYGRRRRVVLHDLFLSENLATILRCRRSLTRGMGMKVERESLHNTRLWFRELYYLEKWSEPELPMFSYSDMRCNDLPVGWTRVSPHRFSPEVVNGWRYRLAFELSRNAWTSSVLTDSDAKERWMEACDTGADRYGCGFVTLRMAKLLRRSRKACWKLCYFRRNENVFGRCRFTRTSGVLRPGKKVHLAISEPPQEKVWGVVRGFAGSILLRDGRITYSWAPPSSISLPKVPQPHGVAESCEVPRGFNCRPCGESDLDLKPYPVTDGPRSFGDNGYRPSIWSSREINWKSAGIIGGNRPE